jgi:hypothetical protein
MKRILYIALLLLFTSCVKDRTKTLQTNSGITDGVISLKDSDTFISSLEAITRVPWNYTAVAPIPVNVSAELMAFRDFLPRKGTTSEINAESLRATMGIAGAFCAGLVNKDYAIPNTLKDTRRVFIEVDIDKGSTFLTDAIRRSVFSRLSRLAWYREASDEEMELLLKTLKEAQSATDTSIAEAQQLLLLGCTAILGSSDTLRN